MISTLVEPQGILSFGRERRKDKHILSRISSSGMKLDRFSDLDYATCSHVIEEALKKKNEHGWERLNQHLPACFILV